MEEDSLYSIKWYKGRREFYRYTPKEPQSIKTFPVAGINVEVEAQSCVKNAIWLIFIFPLQKTTTTDNFVERHAGCDITSRHKHFRKILMRR